MERVREREEAEATHHREREEMSANLQREREERFTSATPRPSPSADDVPMARQHERGEMKAEHRREREEMSCSCIYPASQLQHTFQTHQDSLLCS